MRTPSGLSCLSSSRLALASICPPASADETAPAVALVENHVSHWRIVSPSPNKSGIGWAVAELGKYIEQMSGAKLPVASEAAAVLPAIIIGLRADLAPDDQALLPPAAAGYDGYSIAIIDGEHPRIVLAGDNGRGTIYAVYDLLERLGCRWFYPAQDPQDPEVVPRSDSLAIAPGNWAVASPMHTRVYNGDAWFFNIDVARARLQVDHAMKVRCNLIGWQGAADKPLVDQYQELRAEGLLDELAKRDMGLHGPAHSFNLFLSNDHFAAHPEWFGVRDGKRVTQQPFGAQFCWSNAEARKLFAANVADFARAAPLIDVLNIVPFDGGPACACAECQQLGASSALMLVMNDVLERLDAVRPELTVETVGGYAPMVEPPAAVKAGRRLRIAWAHWGRYMAFGYDDPRYDRRQNLEAWHAAAPGGVTIVQYYSDNFCQPWVMQPFARAIEGDRRYVLARKIDSIYFLIYSPGYWWNHGLNTYLAARSFYDFALDPFAVIDDYATHYYRAAGPLLARYYDEWARDPDLGYRIRGGTTAADRATLFRQRRKLLKPALAAVADDAVATHRVDKVARLHALAEHQAECHRLRHQVELARHAGDFARAGELLKQGREEVAATLAAFHAAAERNEGLIDAELLVFTKLSLEGWLEAEAKAIAAKDRNVHEAELRQAEADAAE